jgi:predicted methyltransferase
LKGGNTEVFYSAEGKDNDVEVSIDDYNPLGTVRKSLNLLEMYPEVTKIVERYGRVHHHVDFRKYKGNQLKLRKGVRMPKSPNNYGMRLVRTDEHEGRAED